MNKTAILSYILDSHNLDIFLVDETWLTADIFYNEFIPLASLCIVEIDPLEEGA